MRGGIRDEEEGDPGADVLKPPVSQGFDSSEGEGRSERV